MIDKENDLEEEITYLFNVVSIFIFNFEKNHSQSGSRYIQNTYRNMGKPRTISSVFSSIATEWFDLEAQFSQLIKSQ